MTKEQKEEFLQYLENLKLIQADDYYREGLDMAISAISTEGEYIKKSELLQHVTTEELSDFKDCDVIHAEEIDELTTYSFPDSKSVINKALEVIKSQRFKAYDWYASLAPTLGKSCQKDYEADMEIYDGVIEAVELYRDSISDNPDSAENKGDLISRQAVLDELEKWDWQELYLPIHFKQILDDVPSVENKGFDGMTNGEVIQALFPNAVIRNDDSMLIKEVLFTSEMWNAPYKAESEGTK